jgi:hypothetical protein
VANIDLQPRDERIIRMIHEYGGVLHKSVIKQKEWPSSKKTDTMDDRLDKLVEAEFLSRSVKSPGAAGAYWLGWRGALWLASDMNHDVEAPASNSRDNLRQLAKDLADVGIRWKAEHNPKDIPHQLLISNIHFAIDQATSSQPHLRLDTWRHEVEWRTQAKRDPTHPDAFFVITDSQNRPGLGAVFLLEVDNTTHPQDNFMRDKIHSGLKYLFSDTHKRIAGENEGRWLEVFNTTDRRRMPKLLKRTKKEVADYAYVFLFAFYEDVITQNPLTAPIWQRADKDTPQTLLEDD